MYYLKENEKIIIWGCGKVGTEAIEKYQKKYEICFLVDSKIDIDSESEYLGYKVYNPNKLAELTQRQAMVIVAMYQWQTVTEQLKRLGMHIFKEYIPIDYLDYKMIDPSFIGELEDTSDIEFYLKRLSQGNKIVAMYGMCHMARYKRILSQSEQLAEQYILLDMPMINEIGDKKYRFLKEKQIWEVCDVVVCTPTPFLKNYDVFNLKTIQDFLKPDCKVITVTTAAFKGYFPQHTEIRDCDLKLKDYFEWGDKNINRMIKQGKSDEEIISILLQEDYYDEEKVEAFFTHSLVLMKMEEQDCTIKIGDFIEKNFRNELLYYSWTHPVIKVLAEVARRILAEFSVMDMDVEKCMLEDSFFKLDSGEELLYPSVAIRIGVQDNLRERKINPGCDYKGVKKLTAMEYIKAYIQSMKPYIKKKVGSIIDNGTRSKSVK